MKEWFIKKCKYCGEKVRRIKVGMVNDDFCSSTCYKKYYVWRSKKIIVLEKELKKLKDEMK